MAAGPAGSSAGASAGATTTLSRRLFFVVLLLSFSASCSAFLTGYNLTSVQIYPWGLTGTLDLLPDHNNTYGADITPLALYVNYQSNNTLRVKIYDPNHHRWEVPFVVKTQNSSNSSAPSSPHYIFDYTTSPFGFSVIRKNNSDVLFNSTPPAGENSFNGLIFEDQYIEINTQLPQNPNIYGLGERVDPLRLTNNSYIIWNRDQGTPVNLNLYGSHPFYLDLRHVPLGSFEAAAHGVFLLNSNGMVVTLSPAGLRYQIIGGILDFYFFTGPEPDFVIQQYMKVIGTPYMIPYWGLGAHQCRWGYHTIEMTAAVVDNYEKYNIPLDTMWNDIDYMDNYFDFTNDPIRFPTNQYRLFTEYLHQRGQHYIMITDPGIPYDPSFEPFSLGYELGVFIMNNTGMFPEIGAVWPNRTVFTDFFHPNASTYWNALLYGFHATAPMFDGLWIDMNEISNFCNGECPYSQKQIPYSAPPFKHLNYSYQGEGFNSTNPPFVPTQGPIYTDTISTDSMQYIDIQYNMHSLYGYSETIATRFALQNITKKRTVVIARSTFAGSGHHGGHWYLSIFVLSLVIESINMKAWRQLFRLARFVLFYSWNLKHEHVWSQSCWSRYMRIQWKYNRTTLCSMVSSWRILPFLPKS